jgi:hypothetical protein
MSRSIAEGVLVEFEAHAARLKAASRSRKNAMEYRNVVEDDEEREALNIIDTLGKRQPQDVYDGDVNLRTLRTLLKMIDERGWERYVYALLALRFSHARFTLYFVSSCTH